ncbi:uncharacterized protein [Macrobrachium rosenbergii]|uniref:uncharacterized protein n=1 Tax=Macrobrachium rosenbergii TaxID=79674 RepID=UPI0034D6FD52
MEPQRNPSKWTQVTKPSLESDLILVAVCGLANALTGNILDNIKKQKFDDDEYNGKIQAFQGKVRLEREKRKNLTLLNVSLTKRVRNLENALQENRKEKENEEMQGKKLEKEMETMQRKELEKEQEETQRKELEKEKKEMQRKELEKEKKEMQRKELEKE